MSDYEERRKAEERIRAENNARTQRSHRLETGKRGEGTKSKLTAPLIPDTDGVPTRDMQPVKLSLRKRPQGEPAEVISINRPTKGNGT